MLTDFPMKEEVGMSRMSREDGLRLAREWRKSGQSKAAFARERGLRAQRLYYWIAKAETNGASASSGGFAEVAVAPDGVGCDVDCQLRVGACTVSWCRLPSAEYLATLLAQVAAC